MPEKHNEDNRAERMSTELRKIIEHLQEFLECEAVPWELKQAIRGSCREKNLNDLLMRTKKE